MSDATHICNVKRTFTATVTISAYSLVDLQTDGSVGVATLTSSATEIRVGFADRAIDQGSIGPIVLLNGGGTAYAEAAATLTTGDALYGASGGTVGSTASGSILGYALSGAVDGDVIEVLLA